MCTLGKVELTLVPSGISEEALDRHAEGLKQLGCLQQLLTVGREELELNADNLMGLTIMFEDITQRLTISPCSQYE